MSIERAEQMVLTEALKIEMQCVADARDSVTAKIKALTAEIEKLKEYRKTKEDFPSYKAINANRRAVESLRKFATQLEDQRKGLAEQLRVAQVSLR